MEKNIVLRGVGPIVKLGMNFLLVQCIAFVSKYVNLPVSRTTSAIKSATFTFWAGCRLHFADPEVCGILVLHSLDLILSAQLTPANDQQSLWIITGPTVTVPRGDTILAATRLPCQKLLWFGHVCLHDVLPKIIQQGTEDGSRHRGRPCKSWKDNIKDWTGQSLLPSLHIGTSQTTVIDGRPLQWRRLSEYPNDVRVSWELILA